MKISSREEACSKSHLFVSAHPRAGPPALVHQPGATVSCPWCCNQWWLQMHRVLRSPGNLCQGAAPNPTSVQGSSSVHSPWWRKDQAEPKPLSLSFAGSAHPHWNPTGFIYLVFCWPLLDKHQKTSFLPHPASFCLGPFCQTPAV